MALCKGFAIGRCKQTMEFMQLVLQGPSLVYGFFLETQGQPPAGVKPGHHATPTQGQGSRPSLPIGLGPSSAHSAESGWYVRPHGVGGRARMLASSSEDRKFEVGQNSSKPSVKNDFSSTMLQESLSLFIFHRKWHCTIAVTKRRSKEYAANKYIEKSIVTIYERLILRMLISGFYSICGVCQVLNFFSHSKSVLNFLSNCVFLYIKGASQIIYASSLTKPRSICDHRIIIGQTCNNFKHAL